MCLICVAVEKCKLDLKEQRALMDKCLQHSCQFLHSSVSCRKQFAGRIVSRPASRQNRNHAQQRCRASMGLGFTDGLILPRTSQPQIETPTNSYGLSSRQMAALGLTDDSIARPMEANEVCYCTFMCTPRGVSCCRSAAGLIPCLAYECRIRSQLRHATAQTRCTRTQESPPQ